MVIPGADWKNQPRNILDWVTILVAVVLVLVHFYQGWLEGGAHNHGIWLVFIAWLVVYFTEFWQPILYLVMAVTTAIITVSLILGGYWDQPIDQVTIVLTTVFLLPMVYLFFHEEGTP